MTSRNKTSTKLGLSEPNYGVRHKDVKFSAVLGTKTMAQAVNIHKVLTVPICLLFMIIYSNYTLPAILYLVLHGTYCACWLTMCCAFPAKNFEVPASPLAYLVYFSSVNMYWIIPWTVISKIRETNVFFCCLSVALVIYGTFVAFCSEAQLYYTLTNSSEPKLIDHGMFKYSRNPSYVGEVMIYSGFALMGCGAWQPWALNIFMWCTFFYSNMVKKDKSISRHPGWDTYKARSGMLFPGF